MNREVMAKIGQKRITDHDFPPRSKVVGWENNKQKQTGSPILKQTALLLTPGKHVMLLIIVFYRKDEDVFHINNRQVTYQLSVRET